jgi:hypothetical protein
MTAVDCSGADDRREAAMTHARAVGRHITRDATPARFAEAQLALSSAFWSARTAIVSALLRVGPPPSVFPVRPPRRDGGALHAPFGGHACRRQ